MNSILLTGANGFLGKHIYNCLNDTYSVTTLSRTFSDFKINLENEIPLFKNRFDVVIHAAGKAHFVPKSINEINEFHNTNVVGTINLLKGLLTSGIPKQIIFISSVSVYGKESGVNINEQAVLLAMDPYGLSKIKAEEIITEWCIKHNVICTIFRLPLVVGSNPPGNLGAMIKGIKNGYYFNIDGGNAKKSMVLADDVATAILNVLNIGGVFNLTDGYHPSFSELSYHISSQFKNNNRILNIPMWAAKLIAKVGDLAGDLSPINSKKLKKINSSLTFDDSKARKEFGWNPTQVLNSFKIIDVNK